MLLSWQASLHVLASVADGQMTAHVVIFPTAAEPGIPSLALQILLVLIYSVASATLLSELHTSQQPSDLPGPLLGWPQQWYLYGLVPLEVFCVLVHPFVFEKKLPFLPLLLTSTFCAVGVTCSWATMAIAYCRQCIPKASEKRMKDQ